MDDMCLRYAHCDGHTVVCYDDTGKYLVTCGTDGDVRIWDGFEDDDPKTHHMGETVTALDVKNGSVYLSTDANTVITYTFPHMECDGTVLQFPTSVYHISSSRNKKFIAAGGGDFLIKVYDTSSKNFSVYRGHDAPILSTAIDPEEKYLASSSCDGSVKVWQLSDQSCVKTLKLFMKSNDFCNSETLCQISWHPRTGKFLAIPLQSELRLYERDSWDCTLCLKDESLTDVLSVAAFSPCGSFISGAAQNGTIFIWETKNGKCISKKEHAKNVKVCSLAWNPSGKEMAFCDVEGQLGIYNDIFASMSKGKVTNIEGTYVQSDDETDLPGDARKKNKSSNLQATDDFLNDFDTNSMDVDNENSFDIGAIKAKLEPKIFGLGEEDDEVSSVISAPADVKPRAIEVPVTTPLQTSFQPSSTPLHLDHRFMLWNTVGIVRCYNTEEENSVDVEFHDASVYHPVHVNNIHGFTMAALSVEGLLLASPRNDDAASKLQCLHIGTWDSNKEWTVDVVEEEEIEAIALGCGWAAAATDKRLLRLFTISGIQCEIFCIPGPVVCLAGRDNQLAISYHKAAGIPGEQNLGLMIVNVSLQSRCVCKDYSLPLTSKAFLAWLGFTDEGHICTVDTAGMVRMLNTTCATKWVPIGNTKSHVKGKSDTYFVVGLSEIQQEIRCIPCKGSRYPAMLPRPTVTVLPFSFPFCEMTSDKGRLEEEQGRSAVVHHRVKSLITSGYDLETELSNIERKWTDVLLKMFALATRTDREYRALDVAELMPNSRVVQGAIKYAMQRHHMALAERLGEVLHKKVYEETSGIDVNGYEEEEHELQTVPNSSMSIRPLSNCSEAEEEKLQPKALSLRRLRDTRDSHFDSSQTEEQDSNDYDCGSANKDASISLLPKSSPVVNPFKVQSKAKNVESSTGKNTSGIDDKLFESTKRLSSKAPTNAVNSGKKAPRQAKLFEKTPKSTENSTSLAPKKFGFALYLDENKQKLITENPNVEEAEIVKIATKLFKQLTPEEKEKYKSKPSKQKNKPSEESLNKRKNDSKEEEQETEENQIEAKKPKIDDSVSLPAGTKNKFSMFSFVKKT